MGQRRLRVSDYPWDKVGRRENMPHGVNTKKKKEKKKFFKMNIFLLISSTVSKKFGNVGLKI